MPEPVTLPGVIAPQVRPEGGVSVRATAAVKPFSGLIVIVEEADWPAFTAAGLAAVTVKSAAALNVKVAVAE